MPEFLYDYFKLFERHPDAVVIVCGGNYIFANGLAKKLIFGGEAPIPLSAWVPEELLKSDAQSACGKAELNGKPLSVNMFRVGDHRVLMVRPFGTENDGDDGILTTINEFFRSPLAMISSAASAMLPVVEGSGSELLTQNLAIIYKNYYKLLRITNNISGLSEMQASGIRLNLETVDLLSLCRNLVDTVSLLTKERGVRLWFKTNLESACTAADFGKTEYVLLNILSNSLKHTSMGDDIIVDLTRTSDFFAVTLSDTGTGIPISALPNVFEPRFRRKALDDPETGLGLGLAYSSFIIEAHGGSMVVESRESRGTVVKFTLPVRGSEKPSGNAVHYGEHGIAPILTELSDILPLDCYDAKYMD